MTEAPRDEYGGFRPEEAARFRERYEQGESIRALARSAHVRDTRIRKAIIGAGGMMHGDDEWDSKRRKLGAEQVDQIVSRYMRGDGQREIAREMQVSQATVRYHLKKAGVSLS